MDAFLMNNSKTLGGQSSQYFLVHNLQLINFPIPNPSIIELDWQDRL